MPPAPSIFHLPERLRAKAAPRLIAADEARLASIRDALDAARTRTAELMRAELARPGGIGQAALDRDLEVHRLEGRLRVLRRFGADVCLGRLSREGDPDPLYIGRFGLSGADGEPLLVDWRTPAAAPYFSATRAHRQGVAARRRYRWGGGRVIDYWDEVLGEGVVDAAPDDESAFIASLGAERSDRMHDVLGTLQADQDAIVRSSGRGTLVVDGGPGTGKTVVALHRAAYLLATDARIGRGGALVVGPSPAYLDYVEDVLPDLGEDGVRLCTIHDLVPEAESAVAESDPRVARLKESATLDRAIERAVDRHERPPSRTVTVATSAGEVEIAPALWAAAFSSADRASTHNDVRESVWADLVDLAVERADPDDPSTVRRELAADDDLRVAFERAWPLLDPLAVVAGLWSDPHLLSECTEGLTDEELALLGRPAERPWTTADLPLLDAARLRVGDPGAAERGRRREAALALQKERMDRVAEELIAADDSELGLMKMLRVEDAQRSLVDESEVDPEARDPLAGPFAHIVVDEAQELTDAQWRMIVRRCPSGSVTVVGDRSQARRGFAESWTERLERVGLHSPRVARLSIGYRTPVEVMREAAPVIRAWIPDANIPESIREAGAAVRRVDPADAPRALEDWLSAHAEGTAAVITPDETEPLGMPRDRRVRMLTAVEAKGMEFDLVVLLGADDPVDDITGVVDRYVAMTRTTRELVLVGRRVRTKSPG